MGNLLKYCLRLADNSLILSHRLGEYTSNGPYLEEDLAITNVALDLIGQAEELYKYAGEIEGVGKSEDDYAYRKEETDYLNVQLVEYPNEDFGFLMARQFFMDVYNYYLYTELKNSEDKTLAAIAAKSLKEVTYHLKRSSEWIIRLGDGTEESHERIQLAINELWMYIQELFITDEVEEDLISKGIAADVSKIKSLWDNKVNEILSIATLSRPTNDNAVLGGYGRNGIHTEYMGYILAEMQYLPNKYPDAIW